MQRTQILATGLLAMIVSILPVSIVSGETPNAKSLDFNRDIRPILSNRCFRCHGPDEKERQGGCKSGLRLDTPRESPKTGGAFRRHAWETQAERAHLANQIARCFKRYAPSGNGSQTQ